MRKILNSKFFNHPAHAVALELLGKYLVRVIDGVEHAHMIVETEAYEGLDDLASHASKGRTSRTDIMFADAGHIYVYLIYGMYHMLNIVTGKKDHPAAVLIRGLENSIGPGRLTKKLLIDRKLNKFRLGKVAGLWIEDRGVKISKKNITVTPRVGVDYAGPIWSKKLWRFLLSH